MRLPIYQLDAFTDQVFRGNPAAVVPLDEWLPDATLQAIALENNLSETAFYVPCAPPDDAFDLRWFTPAVEVDLCGHATLAAARVVLDDVRPDADRIRFQTRSGELTVRREPGSARLVMDFPAQAPEPIAAPPGLVAALGIEPHSTLFNVDVVCVVEDVDQVRALVPDLQALGAIDARGVIVTAAGDATTPGTDFVSRFFAPRAGVPEDPVTGSAHCKLVPYWADRLGKTVFVAQQLSARGGTLWCELHGDRVSLAGHTVRYLEGIITC